MRRERTSVQQIQGRDATATADLPAPSRVHATCAWCRVDFVTIAALFDHVEAGHVAVAGQVA